MIDGRNESFGLFLMDRFYNILYRIGSFIYIYEPLLWLSVLITLVIILCLEMTKGKL